LEWNHAIGADIPRQSAHYAYCHEPILDRNEFIGMLPYRIHRGTEEMMGALTGRWFQLQYR
jgi:hypothetical protein